MRHVATCWVLLAQIWKCHYNFSCKAHVKWSQPVNTTYRKIVGRSIWHAFGHPVAMCCDMLQHVGCCWPKFENSQIFHATFVDAAWCCSRLARFVQQCCTRACALVDFQYPTCRKTPRGGQTQQGGQMRVTCCTQKCCDMLRWNVAIVWPEFANAGPKMLGCVLKCCNRLAEA